MSFIINDSKKPRVLVAMSGGIDSSYVAIWLHKAGYEVVGITMKTWAYEKRCSTSTKGGKQIGCCNADTIEDARQVAATYGFDFHVVEIKENFNTHVVEDFVSKYLSGKTPNPCVLCNTHIKWGLMLDYAKRLACDHIATGHYAQVKKEGGRYQLYKGIDAHKDQSYALWGLSQESLSRTLFPVGGLTKPDIRKYVLAEGFENLVKKKESYEICFIPDNDYRGFLKRRVKGLAERLAGGKFVLENGQVVGTHPGYPFFTVGQRRGLNLALGYPVYVTEIRPERNEVVLGTLAELARDGMVVEQLNMIQARDLQQPIRSTVKVRYNSAGTAGQIHRRGDEVVVHFDQPVDAIAPGQAAVFYDGDRVIGGGWIKSAFQQAP